MITRGVSSSRALGIWVAAALILDVSGAQHVYARPTIAAAVLAACAVFWLLPASVWRAADQPVAVQTGLILLPVAALIAEMIDVTTFVPPNGGWSPLRLALLFGGGALLLAVRRIGTGSVAAVALLLGTAIRLIHMRHIPIVPANGDMLPLVQGALGNLLAGRSPYMTYAMPWPVPLTYLPVTWLSYLPTYLVGIDLRWTNIGAEIVIGGALLWLAAQRAGGRVAWRSEPTLVLWAWLYLQPSVIHWDSGNTAPITWAVLAVLVALVLAGHDRAGAVALGVTAAATPLVAVFGPFVALHWVRRHGFVRTAQLGVISVVVAAALIGPFVAWAPQDFVNGTYRWFNTLDGWPRQKWLETDPPVWSVITGFSGEFWLRGAESWLKPIQALIVLVVAALYWRRGARRETLCLHAAAAYLGFMLFNPVLWPYLYNPVLIVGLVGLVPLAVAQATTAPAVVPASEAHSQPTFS